MTFRYQRRLNLFPGVRLNLSRSGVSVTIGPKGASINVGSRGTYLNASTGVPGLSKRVRLDQPSRGDAAAQPAPAPGPAPSTPASGMQDIESEDVGVLSCDGLSHLHDVLVKARDERASAEREQQKIDRHLDRCRREHRRLKASLFSRLFRESKIDHLAAQIRVAREDLEEARVYVDDCRVLIRSQFSEECKRSAAELMRAWGRASRCQRIWDVTAQGGVNKVAERTAADVVIERREVPVTKARYPLLQTTEACWWIENTNGPDLYFYPAFVVLEDGDRFALLEYSEIRTELKFSLFSEDEAVPTDAEVVSHTWAKVNKDGSPDRRFKDNVQIPQVKYGTLTLTTSSGLCERYMFSNWDAAQALYEALQRHAANAAGS